MAARRWVRIGALAGIVTIFLALVGLIGEFTDVYLIGDEITFAGLMLVLPAFVAGMRGRRAAGRGRRASRDAARRGRRGRGRRRRGRGGRLRGRRASSRT